MFDTVLILPQPWDSQYPRTSIKAFNGIKEKEEVAVLWNLLTKDIPDPFKGLLNIKLWEYALSNSLKDAVYKDEIELIYNEDMSVSEIENLLNFVTNIHLCKLPK